uniref:WGS project CAEQ00000000 data, annotated contig 476 n=1 Tax=Trypanosoma congolense (strain IL3000) TaxID=1068625 RepID=F9WG85_TRYCI|nr:unnamed protein product [Trypanosoma congolense IL3000]
MFDVQASSAQTGGLPPLSTATAGAAPLVSSSIKLGRNPDINIKLTYGERTGEGFSHSPQPLGKHRAPGDLEATLVGSRLHDAKERENAEPACAPSRLPHINPKMKFKRVPGLAKSCKQSSAVKLPSGNKTLENVDSHVSHGKVKCQKEGAVRAVTSLPCATAVTKGEQRVGPIPLGPSGESRNDCEDLCERFCSFIGQLEVDQSSSGGITPRNDAQGQEEFVCLGKSLSIRTLSHSSSIEGTPKLAGADASPNLVPRKARGGRPSLLRGPADSKPALPGASLVRRPSLKELKMERKASIMSLKFREAEGKELGVPDDMPVESTVMQRMLMRGSQRRRTKKDAPSIFSVELPTFDKETGKVGDGCSFPSSLSVAEAIDSVLQLERGEQKLKTTSVGVTKFLKEFPESHEIIHLYFWYIVSHARRVSSERLLIDRHLNLEQVFRTTFSRRVSELPPLSSLERIITSWLSNIELRKSVHRGGVEGAEPPVTGDCEARDSLEDPKKTQGGLHSVPRLVPGSVSGTGGASDWYGNPFSLPSLDSVLLADGCEKEEERRMPLGCTQVPSIQDLKMMACRLANAVDTFTVAHVEVCELRELGERCFHRLAMLFGEAFGRLQADKDEVFSAYMILVPHVVYYTLVYCFPNDYLAGILNSMVRVSIYRVFYFWCSGLVATYVRTTAWPTPNQRRVFTQGHESSGRPELDGELKTPRQNNESRELTPRLSENFPPSSAEELASSDYLPSTGQVDPYGYPNFITDDSFDDIDVDVANGHHRIVLEFKKYVKHVNFLFQKLEQRTTNTHPLLTETPKGEQSDSCNGKKNVRGVCAGKVGGDACGANKGVKPCSSSTSEARNDGGPMKDAARRKKKQKTANPRPSIGWDGRSSPGLGDDDRKKRDARP